MKIEVNKVHKTFGGETLFATHYSESTKTNMNFSAFVPGSKRTAKNAIIFLSGLTCSEENFITKSGVQKYLADTETMIICPDTSPRGLEIDGSKKSYDFGEGASFYINAKLEPYRDNYQMYDYIVKDIVTICKDSFNVESLGISGHSMGGHGAIMIALKNPNIFKSVTAFSPIVNPSICPWGEKAFTGYLGTNKDEWKSWDSTELINSGSKLDCEILVDQGLSDNFLETELLTNNLKESCSKKDQKINLRFQEGYDHSYYFISSFISDHVNHHLKYLVK